MLTRVVSLKYFLNQYFGAWHCNMLDASDTTVLWKFRVSAPHVVVLFRFWFGLI